MIISVSFLEFRLLFFIYNLHMLWYMNYEMLFWGYIYDTILDAHVHILLHGPGNE